MKRLILCMLLCSVAFSTGAKDKETPDIEKQAHKARLERKKAMLKELGRKY